MVINTVVVASGDANGATADAFTSCNAGVGTVGCGIVGGDRMIDQTTGVKGDVSVKEASAGATTVVVASGIADGTNDANLASHTAGIGIVVIGSTGIVGGVAMID